jgi:hypothetical protein
VDAWTQDVRHSVRHLAPPPPPSSGKTGLAARRSAPASASAHALAANLRATLWTNGTATDLNTLIPEGSGWTLLEARGVNARGQIVGTGVRNGDERAFLLTPTTNTSPVAQDDSVRVDSGGEIELRVLANDTDRDGDPLRLMSWTPPRQGAVRLSPDSSALLYRTPAYADGTESFSYVVADGEGGSDRAVVRLHLTARVDPNGAVAVGQAAPNPASHVTTLTVVLPRPDNVSVDVYDVLGHRLARVAHGPRPAGVSDIPLDVSRWSAGTYFCRVRVGSSVVTRKVLVVR